MAVTSSKTDEVLASARKDLQAQLAVVREEIARLAAEEQALTEALSSMNGGGASSSSMSSAGRTGGRSASARSSDGKSPTRQASSRRRRRRRGASKSTAERVKELEGLLGDGPKSRNDLAAALKVSPARVQQLLAELGSSVSSRPDPGQRRGKLWSLKGSGNGAGAPKATAKRSSPAKAKEASARKPASRSNPVAK
jgi:hypothetical protein